MYMDQIAIELRLWVLKIKMGEYMAQTLVMVVLVWESKV